MVKSNESRHVLSGISTETFAIRGLDGAPDLYIHTRQTDARTDWVPSIDAPNNVAPLAKCKGKV